MSKPLLGEIFILWLLPGIQDRRPAPQELFAGISICRSRRERGLEEYRSSNRVFLSRRIGQRWSVMAESLTRLSAPLRVGCNPSGHKPNPQGIYHQYRALARMIYIADQTQAIGEIEVLTDSMATMIQCVRCWVQDLERRRRLLVHLLTSFEYVLLLHLST